MAVDWRQDRTWTSTGGSATFPSQASNGATILINTLKDNITFLLESIRNTVAMLHIVTMDCQMLLVYS